MSTTTSAAEDMATVDMDEVFDEIGQFGRYQKKVFVWYTVYQMLASYFMMVVTFAGRTPQWHCGRDGDYTGSTTDEMNCRLYEAGECTPKYSAEFTSIVSEVGALCMYSHKLSLCRLLYVVGSHMQSLITTKLDAKCSVSWVSHWFLGIWLDS